MGAAVTQAQGLGAYSPGARLDPNKPAALPNGGMIDQTASNQWRDQQSQLAQMLFRQANGQGMSAADSQLQAGTDSNIRNAMAMGQSMPGAGASPMAAYRNILENQAMAQQQGANQAAGLKAQESQAAQGQLGSLLGGARGQDIGIASGNVGFGLQNQGMQMQNQMARAQMAQQQNQFNTEQAFRQQQADIANDPGRMILGGLLGAGGAVLGGLTGGLMGGGGQPSGPTGSFENPGIAYNNMPAQYTAAHGGMVPGSANGGAGGRVDSPANDTVRAMLSPGEVVLPLSVVNDEDAEDKAAAFVAAIKARRAR